MPTSILVTGGTGTLGRFVTPLLREAGASVLSAVCTRDSTDGVEYVTGNLSTGVGIQAAVEGIDTVVHCAGGPKHDDDKARSLVNAMAVIGRPTARLRRRRR